MSTDLSCKSKKHAILISPGIIEVKCSSRFCGAGAGVVVLHRFDASTGALVGTTRYKTPLTTKDKVA